MTHCHISFVSSVSGTGKSTLSQHLAQRFDMPFEEGDRYHSEANVEKMSSGIPLQDADRWEWLITLNMIIMEIYGKLMRKKLVLSCLFLVAFAGSLFANEVNIFSARHYDSDVQL